jgi:hypothetical protein
VLVALLYVPTPQLTQILDIVAPEAVANFPATHEIHDRLLDALTEVE